MIGHRSTIKKIVGAPPRTPFELDRDRAKWIKAAPSIVMETISMFLAGFVFYWLWVILP
jgi:hypothetical protein